MLLSERERPQRRERYAKWRRAVQTHISRNFNRCLGLPDHCLINVASGRLSLKLILQRELHHPPIVGDARTLTARRDPAEGIGRLHAQTGGAQIDMVEKVEEFRAKLKIISLADAEVLVGRS